MDTMKRQDIAAFLRRLAEWKKANPKLGPAASFKDVNASTPHGGYRVACQDRSDHRLGREGWFQNVPWHERRVRQDMTAFLHRMKTNVLG